jgi:hypothetical protein
MKQCMTEETLDDIGTRLKANPKQCLCFLPQKCCVSETLVHVTTKPFYILTEQTPILTDVKQELVVGDLVIHNLSFICMRPGLF